MSQGNSLDTTVAPADQVETRSPESAAALNAAAGRLLTAPSGEAPPNRLALLAYSSWLYEERSYLCRELYPHLGWRAGHFIVANSGLNFHRPHTPPASTRAAAVLATIGCDWSNDADFGIGDDGGPYPQTDRFPHPDGHLLDLCDAFDAARARYETAEKLAVRAHDERRSRLDTYADADKALVVGGAPNSGWYWQGSAIRQILAGSYRPTAGVETSAIARLGIDGLKALLPLAEERDRRIDEIDEETNYPALREAANDLLTEADLAARAVYRRRAKTFEGLARKVAVIRASEPELWVHPDRSRGPGPELHEYALTEIADSVEHLLAHGVVRGSDIIGGAAYSGPEAVVSEEANRDGTVTYLDASGKCWTNSVSHWIGFTAARMWAIARQEMGRRLNDPALSDEARAELDTTLRRELRTDAIHGLAFRFEDAFRAGEDERRGVDRGDTEPTIPALGIVSPALERATEVRRETAQIMAHDPAPDDDRLTAGKARLSEAEAAVLAIEAKSLADLRHKVVCLWPGSLEDHVSNDRIRTILENFREDLWGLCRAASASSTEAQS